ncbi:MAG: glycosyltransferase family 4 protein [Coriobacteriia bacterium]|nr:glycosyltransferase family 4 protein [Coriobacteriia bacterium]
MRPLIVMHVLQEYRFPALEALKQRYPETRVIVSEGGTWASGQNARDIELRDDVTVLGTSVTSVAGASIVFFRGLREAVRDSGADVLLLDPRMGLPSVWSLAVWPPRIHGTRIPSVWWFAGWNNRERAGHISAVAEALQRQVIRRADGAACYSSAAMRSALRLGIPADKAVLAQNATATSALEEAFASQPMPMRDDKLHLLYVGRVEARKHLEIVLEAIASPSLLGRCCLRVVGSGPETVRLRSRADALRLGHAFEMAEGTHDPAEVARHLRWADIGILPNQGGLFLNTAMSCGVPVVCGRADGTEEDLVEDGVTGWRLAEASVAELAAVLTRLLAERSAISEVGARALNRYRTTATLDHMVEGIDSALRRAVAGTGGG